MFWPKFEKEGLEVKNKEFTPQETNSTIRKHPSGEVSKTSKRKGKKRKERKEKEEKERKSLILSLSPILEAIDLQSILMIGFLG